MKRSLLEDAARTIFWPECHRRIYRDIDRFSRPETLEVAMVVSLAMCGSYGPAVDDINRFVAVASRKIQQYDVQMMFVERPLVESLLRSEPPGEIDWRDVHLPFPAAAIMLPRNVIRTHRGAAVPFVAYARVLPGDVLELPGYDMPVRIENDGLIVFTSLYDVEPERTLAVYLDSRSIRTVGEACRLNIPGLDEEGTLDISDNDGEIVRLLTHLVFSLSLALSARPEIGDLRADSELQSGRHKRSGLPIYEPRIIGRNYLVKRLSYAAAEGHGTPKRPHWRRGHFRSQPFGPAAERRYKTIWIEPVFVSGSMKS